MALPLIARAAWGVGKWLLGGGVMRQAAIGSVAGGIGGAMEDTNRGSTRFENIVSGAAGGAFMFGGATAAFKYAPKIIGAASRANAAAGSKYAAGQYKKLVGAGNFNRRMKNPALRADYNKRFSRFRHTPAARGAMGMAGGIGRGAMGVGQFAMKHPRTVAAGVIGTGAVAGSIYAGNRMATTESPTMAGTRMNANYAQQEMAVQNMLTGVAPMGRVGSAATMMGPMHRAMRQSTEGLVQGLHRGRH